MIAGSVLSLVTLFLNNTIQNDMDNYIPKETAEDIVFFYYNTTYNEHPIPVDDEDDNEYLFSAFFPKCCKPGFLYEPENRNCEEAQDVSQIYEDLNISVNLIRYGLLECLVLIDRFVDKNNLKRLDGDGSLLINNTTFPNGQFCVDKIQGNDDYYVIRLCQGVDYCLDRNSNNSEKDWCIYKCCPDTYALIDGQCKQSPKMGLNVKQYKNLYEKIGYIYFFTMISRLSWLNVLSYEIWQNLGKTRAKVGETSDDLWKRFMYLCIYAIAVPLSCTFLFILGNQGILSLPETIKPYIRPPACAIDTNKFENYGHYLFLYLPIWTLIIINLVFYVKTILHFLKIKHELKRISNTNHNRKDVKMNQKNGFIILKLGLIMGITWIYYIYDFLTSFKEILVLQTVGDFLRFSNILEGFYFLIIFVVKWKTIKEILHKLNIVKKQRQKTLSTSTTSTGSVTLSSDESVDTVPMETLSK